MTQDYCKHCRHTIDTGSATCPYCGAAQAGVQNTSDRTAAPRSVIRSRPFGVSIWSLLAAGLIVIIGLVSAFTIYNARVAALTQTQRIVQHSTAPVPSQPSTREAATPVASLASSKSPAPPAGTEEPSATARAQQTDAAQTQTIATAAVVAQTATAFAPLAPDAQAGLATALAQFDPALETSLLQNGYQKNIISRHGRRGLRASQRNYSASVWARDLDYAISGYGYALGDMTLFRESIELFLKDVTPDGVAPETIHLDRVESENRKSWDSMPNLIHMVYIYTAKTGDRAFYEAHRTQVEQVGAWIVGLDSDGDSLPDRVDFPYGYYDSVKNGVQHTYALAKFYAAFNELSELERYAGRDGSAWGERARQLREGFHRPFDQGGYWVENQAWPIAWRRSDGSAVDILETFGVFEALRSGLIGSQDGARYQNLVLALHERLPELLDGPTPLRLALGGYDPGLIRDDVIPPVPQWMLDASAPWVVGLAAPVYAAAGYPDDAATLLAAYAEMARTTDPPVLEFAAGPSARYGPGDTGDRGRTWDSAAWFLAVYGGHYGLALTPEALIVRPRPFAAVPSDGIHGLSYQGATVQLTLDAPSRTYRIRADRPIRVVLRPIGKATRVRVDNGTAQAEVALLLEPGHEYVVANEGST
jgi:hypothetical protein